MSPTTTKRSQGWVLAVTAVASFVVSLDALVVSTALGTIRLQLHASINQLEWTVNAYVLSFAVLMMTAAALGDRLGRRRLFTAGLGLFAVASAACALSPGVDWLIAARALQGVGAALVMPLSLTLLGTAFPPERRGWAMGVFAGLAGLAVLCGPLLGGAVVQGLSWPWIFWLNVPIALALVPLALTRIPESHGPGSRLDVPGLVGITGAVFGVVWGLVGSSAASWLSIQVWPALGLGALLAALVVLWEHRAPEPLLPLGLFHVRSFAAGNVAMFCFWASGLGSLFFMAQFLQTGLGYGPLATGLRLMPWGATTVIAPQVAGALINRVGERVLVVCGLFLQSASMVSIAMIAAPHVPYWQIVPPLVLSGTGVAIASPAIQSAVIGSVARKDTGKASGTLSTIRQLGGLFGVAALASVFASRGSYATAQAFIAGFVAAAGASGALALLGAFAGIALTGRRAVIDVGTVAVREAR